MTNRSDVYDDFEPDNEPFTDEMYDEIATIDRIDSMVEDFFKTPAGIERKQAIAKALGETSFERIDISIQRSITLAMRDLIKHAEQTTS